VSRRGRVRWGEGGREALIRRLVFYRKMVPHGLACGGNCFRAGEQFTTPNRAIRRVRRCRAVSAVAALHVPATENFALPQHGWRLEAHAGCCHLVVRRLVWAVVAEICRSVKLRVATALVELSRNDRRERPLIRGSLLAYEG